MLVSELVLVIDNRCLVITIDKKKFSTEKKKEQKKRKNIPAWRCVASRLEPHSLPGTPVISLPVPRSCRCQCCEPEEPVVVIIKVLTYGPKDVNNVFWAVFFCRCHCDMAAWC